MTTLGLLLVLSIAQPSPPKLTSQPATATKSSQGTELQKQVSVLKRIQDVVYAKQQGAAFTLDISQPRKSNGKTIVFMVSGGWVSDHKSISTVLANEATEKGFTLVQVVHGAQPRYKVPEIVAQVIRSVRFIRANAKTYGIDPTKIGIMGGSAGGHLSLMVASKADNGNPASSDPVERASSEVQSVGIFYPPTDFLNYGKEGQFSFDIPALKQAYGEAFIKNAKDASRETMLELAKQNSPMGFFTKSMPPTLIVHGDKDTLVPIQQSQVAIEKLTSLGVKAKLITVPGGGHGWPNMAPETLEIMNWFESTLK